MRLTVFASLVTLAASVALLGFSDSATAAILAFALLLASLAGLLIVMDRWWAR